MSPASVMSINANYSATRSVIVRDEGGDFAAREMCFRQKCLSLRMCATRWMCVCVPLCSRIHWRKDRLVSAVRILKRDMIDVIRGWHKNKFTRSIGTKATSISHARFTEKKLNAHSALMKGQDYKFLYWSSFLSHSLHSIKPNSVCSVSKYTAWSKTHRHIPILVNNRLQLLR